MSALPMLVLAEPEEFWLRLRADRLLPRDLLALVVFIVIACGLYGAVMAGWRSPKLACYVAIKLPLVMLLTVGAVSVFNWIAAMSLGCGFGYRQTLFLAAGSMTTAGWLLLALVPVTLLFMVTGVPRAGTPAQLRDAHNMMLVTHIAVLGAAGVAGNARLLRWIASVAPSRARALALFITWLAAFAFAGCQLSWMLRPFVGSPFYPVAFLRADALDRNFYEFVVGEVLPNLVVGGD